MNTNYDTLKEYEAHKEPLPSYDEWKSLQKKLEIATKALKKLTRDCNKWGIAREALKEMEGVK